VVLYEIYSVDGGNGITFVHMLYIHLSFQIYGLYGEGQVVNAQHYVFYFESDNAKVFPFRPTCSSYDSERKKSKKVSQKGPDK
jgi:hypothetical protein